MHNPKASISRTVISILFGALAIYPVSAKTDGPCSDAMPSPALGSEWIAVRQQYEPDYQPIEIAPQGHTRHLAFVMIPALSSEWIAVRQQYERGYRPDVPETAPIRRLRFVTLPALAPEWVAVRQQYETSYQPVNPNC